MMTNVDEEWLKACARIGYEAALKAICADPVVRDYCLREWAWTQQVIVDAIVNRVTVASLSATAQSPESKASCNEC